MILSYPKGVSVDQVERITRDVCAQMFDEGARRFRYVAAVHDDTVGRQLLTQVEAAARRRGVLFDCDTENRLSDHRAALRTALGQDRGRERDDGYER